MDRSVIPAFMFMGAVAYTVLGNFVVYVILVSRKVLVRFGYVGAPFHLHRACVQASPAMPCLRAVTLSTDIAVLLAALAGSGPR
jgi:hypothetical protein